MGAEKEACRRVYVGNLAYKTSWQTLKDHFRKVGEVIHAEIFQDRSGKGPASVQGRPLSKGCGVVEFARAVDAERAIKELMDSTLDSRLIFVREDREAPLGDDEKGRRNDWPCPKCGDLQFARNIQCRKCGTPKPGLSPGRSASRGRRRRRRSRSPRSGSSASASKSPRRSPRRSRSRSSRAPAPSAPAGPPAALGGAQTFKPGDWTCPACNDHQFARNQQCRRCGHLKPSKVSQAGGSRPRRRSSSGSRSRSRSRHEHRRRRRRRVRKERKEGRGRRRRTRRKDDDGAAEKKARRRRRRDQSGSSAGSSSSGSSSDASGSATDTGEAAEVKAAKGAIAGAKRATDKIRLELQAIEERMGSGTKEEGSAGDAKLQAELTALQADSNAAVQAALEKLERDLRQTMERKLQQVRDEFAVDLRDGTKEIKDGAAASMAQQEKVLREQAARRQKEESSKTTEDREAHTAAQRRLDAEEAKLAGLQKTLAALREKDAQGSRSASSGSSENGVP